MQPSGERIATTLAATAAVLAAPVAARDAAAADAVAAALAARLAAMLGVAVYADLPVALREAELQALQISLSMFSAGRHDGADTASGRDAAAAAGGGFHRSAVEYSASALAQLAKSRGGQGLRRLRIEAPDNPEDFRRRARLAHEEAVLGEIDLAVGARRLPERFLASFFDGGATADTGAAAWSDAFGLYVAWYLRSDAGLCAGLAAEPLPALTERGVTVPGLLEAVFAEAKRTALRIERRLAETEAAAMPADVENGEVGAYLDRLVEEQVRLHGLPAPALRALRQKISQGQADWRGFEDAFREQAGCLVRLAAGLARAAATSADAAAALALLREGRLAEASARLDGARSTEHLLASGRAAAVAADWPAARARLNRAIAGVAVAERGAGIDLARELARVAALEGSPGGLAMAAEIGQTLLAAPVADLEPAARAEVAVDLVAAAAGLSSGPAQLKALTAAAGWLAGLPATTVVGLPVALRLQLARARGDVEQALWRQGADRLGAARTAYAEALRLAVAAADPRAIAVVHLRLADLAMARAGKSPVEAAPALRAEAMASLRAAQAGQLRGRDPILWASIKLRIGEMLVATRGADEAAAQRAGIIAAKAGLRLLPPRLMPLLCLRGLAVVADGFARLSAGSHAVAACEEALALPVVGTDAAQLATVMERLATTLLAQGEAVTSERLLGLAARLQAMLPGLADRPPLHNALRRLLADSHAAVGRRRMEPRQFELAVGQYRDVIAAVRFAKQPALWCNAWVGLAAAARELATLGGDAADLARLVDELSAAARQLPAGSPAWIGTALAKSEKEAREALRRLARRDASAEDEEPRRKLAALLRRA